MKHMPNPRAFFSLLAAAALCSSATLAWAESNEQSFKSAYNVASMAAKRALAMKAGWTTTTSTLSAAQKAADAKDFEQGVRLAKEAEALANASIAQAERESKLWRDSDIR